MQTPKQVGIKAANRLFRAGGTAALSVLDARSGDPLVTMVNTAVDEQLRPLILISALSLHTRCLTVDPRASLMLHEDFPAESDPQTALRVTLSGIFAALPAGEEAKIATDVFLARHPYAGLYAGFGDFAIWRMEPTRVHIIAGFGRAYDVSFADLANSSPEA